MVTPEPMSTITKISEKVEQMDSNAEMNKKYLDTFQKHKTLLVNIANKDKDKDKEGAKATITVNMKSVEKIIAKMPEKLKYGISYILFSITSTEVIEEVETTSIMKKIVKKYEFEESKEVHFQTDLAMSTKLVKGGFNTALFKNLEKILNAQKAKESSAKSSTSTSAVAGGTSKTTTTTKRTQTGNKQTIVTETVVEETVEEVVEIQEVQTKTKTVTKSKAINQQQQQQQKKKPQQQQQKEHQQIEEAPQSEGPQGDAPKKKAKRNNDDEEQREDVKESTKETQKPTRPTKPQPQQQSQPQPHTQSQSQSQSHPVQQIVYQSYPTQSYSFYSSNTNGLQLPHKYRTHPRIYGKDSRACRVCNNTHGLIRKYKLDICRRCFRERATLLGWKQDK